MMVAICFVERTRLRNSLLLCEWSKYVWFGFLGIRILESMVTTLDSDFMVCLESILLIRVTKLIFFAKLPTQYGIFGRR